MAGRIQPAWSTERVIRWCCAREIREIADGAVKNMDEVDLAAILEGQAERKMRGYSRHSRIWDERP